MRYNELIDTCWNVNTLCSTTSMEATLELIDTCWNVNEYANKLIDIINDELIDTCWNVNYVIIKRPRQVLRINRYMLECKFLACSGLAGSIPELIDTCWNVNLERSLEHLIFINELIDTCWNVNDNV